MFFYVRSASAVLLFPLFPGSAPALLLAAIFRGRARRARPLLLLYVLLGAEPEGLDPYCYCMFYYYYYYYYYYYSSLPMGVYGSPMKGTWENDEIWHTWYGYNSDLTNFGVSKTTSIAPPPVQKFNIKWL